MKMMMIMIDRNTFNTGNKPVFHALTFARPRTICSNTRPLGRVIKHLLRELAGVNAMKQRCVMVILAFYLISTH